MNRFLVKGLFGIEGLNIAWYAVIMCIGIVAGVITAYCLSKKRGYKFDVIIDFLILAIPLAVICARLYYVFSEWGYYSQNPGDIIAVWKGGLAIYGAVIGGIIAALIFCKWKKVPLGDVLDFAGCGLIIGQAIGRWGNFVNQEAFGVAVTDPGKQWFPYAVKIDGAHTVAQFDAATNSMINVTCQEPWHMATFFYESMWNLLVFAVLLWFFYKKAKRPGNVFALYLTLYGLGRVFIEGLRTDSLWLIPGVIRISQALAALCVIGGILYLLLIRKKPLPAAYNGPYCLVKKDPEDVAAEAAPEESADAAQEDSDAEEVVTGDAEETPETDEAVSFPEDADETEVTAENDGGTETEASEEPGTKEE